MSSFNNHTRRDEPKSPCIKECPDRGKPCCHNDDCPHGWKKYKEDLAEYRRKINLASEYGRYRQRSFDKLLADAAVDKKLKKDYRHLTSRK